MIPGGPAHGVRATVWRWWQRRELRRAMRIAPLYRALTGINTALGVYAPEPGTATIADPVAHLRAARRHIHEYLKGVNQ